MTAAQQLEFDLGLAPAKFHMLRLVTVAEKSAECFCGLVVVRTTHQVAQREILAHVEAAA